MFSYCPFLGPAEKKTNKKQKQKTDIPVDQAESGISLKRTQYYIYPPGWQKHYVTEQYDSKSGDGVSQDKVDQEG